jgi:hypothetical protein
MPAHKVANPKNKKPYVRTRPVCDCGQPTTCVSTADKEPICERCHRIEVMGANEFIRDRCGSDRYRGVDPLAPQRSV